MKRNTFKVFLMVLACCLLASCAQTAAPSAVPSSSPTSAPSTATTDPTPQATEQAAESPFAETLELTWMGYTGSKGDPVPADDRIKPIIEERFNVKIKKAEVDWTDKEKIVLYFASGNTADVMFIRQLDRNALVNQGLIRSFDANLLNEHMPTWMSYLKRVVDPEIIEQQLYYNGKCWGVPFTNESRISPYVYLINKTWVKNSGLNDVPKSLDELHTYLKYVTFEDPDKNGAKDTYGLSTAAIDRYFGLGVVFNHFGVFPKSYHLVDGKIKSSIQMDEYKEALKLLAKWYAEGLIDPEFTTKNSYDLYMEMGLNQAKLGMYSAPIIYYLGSRLEYYAEHYPDYEYDMFIGIPGKDGKVHTPILYPTLYTGQYPYYFGAQTSDQKMIRGMQILEAFCVDPELALMTQFGEVEKHGENWTLVNGVYKNNPDFNADKSRSAADVAMDARSFYCVLPSNLSPIKVLDDVILNATATALENPKTYIDFDFNFTGENESYSTYKAELETLEDTFILNVILGRVNADEAYESFLNDWLTAGGQEVLAGFQAMVDKK